MRVIDDSLMAEISTKARNSPRLRHHLNFHESYADPSQRMLIAMEPGSYIRPHRHLEIPKPEAFLVLRGKIALVTFDDNGEFLNTVILKAGGPAIGVDLPPGVWHTLIPLESETVFYETKPGPFIPIPEGDMAPWAPPEGGAEANNYLTCLQNKINKSLVH